jgi:alpha-glucosidase
MPWKESRTLAGEIGEYIVMMRETDEAYLVGVATNEQERTVDVPLTFIGTGAMDATIIEDGDGAHYLTNRECLKTSTRQVTQQDVVQVKLASGGGACILIKKAQ